MIIPLLHNNTLAAASRRHSRKVIEALPGETEFIDHDSCVRIQRATWSNAEQVKHNPLELELK